MASLAVSLLPLVGQALVVGTLLMVTLWIGPLALVLGADIRWTRLRS